MIRTLLRYVLLAAIVTSSGSCCASDCVFDPASIDLSVYSKNPDVMTLVWDDAAKQGRMLLRNGDFVFVQRWACAHYGTSARLVSVGGREISGEPVVWREKIQLLARVILDAHDGDALTKALDERANSEPPSRIDVPGTTYSEFYLSVEQPTDTLTVVAISFYGN